MLQKESLWTYFKKTFVIEENDTNKKKMNNEAFDELMSLMGKFFEKRVED